MPRREAARALSLAMLLAVCAPDHARAQTVLSDEEYLVTIENAASACLYFSALTHLPRYDPAIAEQVVTQVCQATLDRFDEEGCRIEGGMDDPSEEAGCVAARIYSEVLVTSTVNMMRMVAEAHAARR